MRSPRPRPPDRLKSSRPGTARTASARPRGPFRPGRGRLLSALLALAALLAPLSAEAGAWPRAKGAAFLSWAPALDHSADPRRDARPFDRFEQIYAELGLGRQVTVAVEAYREDLPGRPWSGLLTLRRLALRGDDGSVISAEIGAGLAGDAAGEDSARLRAGLSYGRGLSEPFNGWLGLDLSHETRPFAGVDIARAAATLGMKPTRELMLILQLQAERRDGDKASLKLAPSAALRLTGRMTLQLSGEHGLVASDGTELRLKVWLEF